MMRVVYDDLGNQFVGYLNYLARLLVAGSPISPDAFSINNYI